MIESSHGPLHGHPRSVRASGGAHLREARGGAGMRRLRAAVVEFEPVAFVMAMLGIVFALCLLIPGPFPD